MAKNGYIFVAERGEKLFENSETFSEHELTVIKSCLKIRINKHKNDITIALKSIAVIIYEGYTKATNLSNILASFKTFPRLM